MLFYFWPSTLFIFLRMTNPVWFVWWSGKGDIQLSGSKTQSGQVTEGAQVQSFIGAETCRLSMRSAGWHESYKIQYVLYFDLRPSPKNAISKWCTGRKWHIPMASNRKRSRGQIKAYNMGQGEGPTVPLQWCTGREWPVNCMTVISARWRLNIRFQISSGRSCGRWIII